MRALILSTLLIATAAAGCLSSGSQPEGLAPSADPLPEGAPSTGLPEGILAALTVGGCDEQMGILPIPMDVARMDLPEGFAPIPFDAAGLFGALVVIGYQCDGVTGQDLELGESRALWGGLAVSVPAAYAVEGYDFYMVTYGAFISDPTVAETLAAWGIASVGPGVVTYTSLADTPGARAGTVSGSADGHAVTLATAPAAVMGGDQPAGASRWFTVMDGVVTAAFDWTWNESAGMGPGAATLVFDDGGLNPAAGIVAVEAFPPPVNPGIGMHYGAETYAYGWSHVPADRLVQAPAAPEEGAVGAMFRHLQPASALVG